MIVFLAPISASILAPSVSILIRLGVKFGIISSNDMHWNMLSPDGYVVKPFSGQTWRDAKINQGAEIYSDIRIMVT